MSIHILVGLINFASMPENPCSVIGIPFTPSAQPSFHDRDPVDTPAPQPPPVAYYYQGRGIRVIQQYVTAISEGYNSGDAREREQDT
jgi:hypothetical protein